MNAPLVERLLTVEEFETLADTKGCELIDGRLREKPMGAESSEVAVALITLLRPFVLSQQLGRVYGADCGYQLFPDKNRVRKPDASFVRQDRLPGGQTPPGDFRIRPDLAVEAGSPNDEAFEIEEKIDEYLRAGVPLVWVIFPNTQSVMIYRADGTAARVRSDGELSGETVVPGFRCKVADLFA